MATTPDTELTFYDDLYRTELEVWVDAAVADERFGTGLVLSRTLCHPHGGGQKGDRAVLELAAGEAEALGVPRALPIADTRRVDGRVLHLLGAPLEADAAEQVLVGARAIVQRLDWDFRHRQMRLHSAAHLLHCFVAQVLGGGVDFPETSDLQPDYGLNRYERKELLTPEQMAEVVTRLNAFAAEAHPIVTFPDESRPGFRYWQCGEWLIPCGGTHPARTDEIGPVSADLSLKRGRTSMTFRVGAA